MKPLILPGLLSLLDLDFILQKFVKWEKLEYLRCTTFYSYYITPNLELRYHHDWKYLFKLTKTQEFSFLGKGS